MKRVLIVLAILFFALVVRNVIAVAPAPYKVICHHTPGNDVTLEFLNEQSYSGHLGIPHSGSTFDTDGACESTSPSVSPSVSPSPEEDDTVTLCHATHSQGNPFDKITVAVAAALNGHLGANHQNGEDIIPPFTYLNQSYSQNWPSQESTFNNACVPTNETITPTQTPGRGGDGGSGGGGGNNGTPVCTSEVPNSVGNVWTDYSQLSQGIVTVHWVPVLKADKVNIRYGNDGVNWPYSALNLGNGGVATISGLAPDQKWYFQVQGVNGCQPGEFASSRTLAATGGFTDSLMNLLLGSGMALLALGTDYATKKAKAFKAF